MQGFGGEYCGKEINWKTWYNIKMDLLEVGLEGHGLDFSGSGLGLL
jgi:hypothetical protein